MFDRMRTLIKGNPILQFSKVADRNETPLLVDQFSSTALGAGLGQTMGSPSEQDVSHARMAQRQRLLFGMMKFDMNKKRSL